MNKIDTLFIIPMVFNFADSLHRSIKMLFDMIASEVVAEPTSSSSNNDRNKTLFKKIS